MRLANKTLLSFLICTSFALSVHASVSPDDDGQNAGFAGASSYKPSLYQPPSPQIIVQNITKISDPFLGIPTEQKDQKLTQIVALRGYFKKGFLEITPKTCIDLLQYAMSYKDIFAAYDRGVSLKGWADKDETGELLKLFYHFNAVKGIKCRKNTWQPKALVNTLIDAIQHYEMLETLDLKDSGLNDKEITKLLKVLPNPSSLKSLNIKASVLDGEALSQIKKKYPQLEDVIVGKMSPKMFEKKEMPTLQDTTALLEDMKLEEPKAPSLKPLYRPNTEAQAPVVTSGTPKTPNLKEEERPGEMSPTIPPVAKGYEEIYKRFLKGVLIYRPQEGSDVGMIKLPIAQLTNPLEGTFDLSQCGDAGKYLSIATGYRKGKIAKNKDKVEVWLAPRFLIEKELKTTASHFQEIMSNWSETAPVGLFWTGGWWDNLSVYYYLTTENTDELSNNNLYEKRLRAWYFESSLWWLPNYSSHSPTKFHVRFMN